MKVRLAQREPGFQKNTRADGALSLVRQHIRRGPLLNLDRRRIANQCGKRLRRRLELPDVFEVEQEIVRCSKRRFRSWSRAVMKNRARAVRPLPRACY